MAKFQIGSGELRPSPAIRPSEAAAILAAALLLCWPAFLNGFPLVFSDTGTYLGQAKLFYLGWDRPPFYSIFLRIADGGISLWAPILAQAVIVAHLLFLTLRSLGRRGPWPFLAISALLAALTNLPWIAAELIADVFTGVVVLALWLLGFGTIGRWERIYLVILATGAISVHVSHVPFALGLVLVAGALAWYGKSGRAGLRAALSTMGRMALAPALAAAAIVLVNLIGHGSASLSPFGSVIHAARLIGDGPGEAYLREACPTRRFAICAHLDNLGAGGSEFIWRKLPQMPDLGGPKEWAPEARAIVNGTIKHDPQGVLLAALDNTARQFTSVWIGHGLNAWPGEPGPGPMIARFFPWELGDYQESAQSAGTLKRLADEVAPLLDTVAWIGLAGLVVAAVVRRRHRAGFALCVLLVAAALGNAFITGALSGVESRYQARIAWLFVFAFVAMLAAARPAKRPARFEQGDSAPAMG